MCLTYNHNLTKELQARTEKFTAYKIYYVGKSGIEENVIRRMLSPFRINDKSARIVEPGTYESSEIGFTAGAINPLLPRTTIGPPDIEHDKMQLDISGFHSFLSRIGAKMYFIHNRYTNANFQIVEVTIDPQDIVAAGLTLDFDYSTETVVSTKITVSKEEFDKIPYNCAEYI